MLMEERYLRVIMISQKLKLCLICQLKEFMCRMSNSITWFKTILNINAKILLFIIQFLTKPVLYGHADV